jgi:hypothetical protein
MLRLDKQVCSACFSDRFMSYKENIQSFAAQVNVGRNNVRQSLGLRGIDALDGSSALRQLFFAARVNVSETTGTVSALLGVTSVLRGQTTLFFSTGVK